MQLLIAITIVAFGSGVATASIHDRPKPKVYAKKTDRELARLLDKPCLEADVGRGCIKTSNGLWRKRPCVDYDNGSIIHRRTDQCFKMEQPRRFRGTLINEFEGQLFILEGAAPPEWPRSDRNTPGWAEKFEKARAASIWLDNSRVDLVPVRLGLSNKMLIEFVGRKTKYTGRYGHMGMSGNSIIVDRVISLKNLD